MRLLLFVVTAVAACGNATAHVATVTVEPLPKTAAPPRTAAPPLAHASLLDVGCTPGATKPLLDCSHARIDGIGECQMPLYRLPVEFEPQADVAQCVVLRSQRGIRRGGCMMPSAYRLVVATAKGAFVLSSREEVVKMFAPVTSPREAIAFAVVLTGGDAVERTDPGAKTLGVTDVTRDGADFKLRLFTTPMCGWSHPTYGVDYRVTRAGDVEELSRAVVYEDPKMRGLCVD